MFNFIKKLFGNEVICSECLRATKKPMARKGYIYCGKCFYKLFVRPKQNKFIPGQVDPGSYQRYKVDGD